MNPTLLQHPSSFELSLGPDLKYPTQDRSYSSLNALSNNGYGNLFSQANRGNGLTNPSAGSTFSLEHNSQPLLSDQPFHTSPQLLLSPHGAVNGSTTASSYSTLSTLAHTTLPKPYASNASSSDHFTGASGGVLSSSWGDVSMTGYDRHKLVSTIPSSAYTTHGMTNHNLTRSMDPRPYQTQGTSLGTAYLTPTPMIRPPQPPFPRNGQYYTHDHPYAADVSAMSQSDANETKGPSFDETLVHEKLLNQAGSSVGIDICASIQKGFFEVDNKWTCYRRNYFTVNCAFQLNPHQVGPLYIMSRGQNKTVEGWAVSISAKTAAVGNEASQTRGLVQHTPKRDKNGETVPGRHAVSPQAPQQHHLHEQSHQHHHHHPHSGTMGMHGPFYAPQTNHLAALGRWPETNVGGEPTPPSSYTFERIQFQKATANNGKRRAQQQFFHVVVQLSANVHPIKGQEEWVLVAEKVSDPMVVRGRSPGHYKDNHQRPDRHAHMDDRNGGQGSAPHRMSYGGFGGGSWGMQDDSQRDHNSHFGGGTRRSCLSSNGSPPSGGSSATLNGGSPTDVDFSMSDSETLKTADMYGHPRLTPPLEHGDESLFSLNRKRRLDDESGDDESSAYQFNTALCDNVATTAAMDYSAFSRSKILCASS